MSFVYDFNLVYEIARLGTDPNYESSKIGPFVWRRNGRPLKDEDRLQVESLRLESPLVLVTIIAAVPASVGAIWGMVQTIEKVSNFPLNRRKLKAEVEKLERENAEAAKRLQLPRHLDEPPYLLKQLDSRGAVAAYERVGGRLEQSSIRVKEIDVELVERQSLKDENKP